MPIGKAYDLKGCVEEAAGALARDAKLEGQARARERG